MGKSYIHHKMIGIYIDGEKNALYSFFDINGYTFTEEQITEIQNGEFAEDLIELFGLEGMEIINVDSWSGHDFVIGYSVGKKMTQKVAKEKFLKYFPEETPELHDFTEVS